MADTKVPDSHEASIEEMRAFMAEDAECARDVLADLVMILIKRGRTDIVTMGAIRLNDEEQGIRDTILRCHIELRAHTEAVKGLRPGDLR